MNFKKMLTSYTVWAVLGGFVAGVLLSLFCFNTTVEQYMIETNQEEKIETVFYTVEMMTDEMEAEWIQTEK